MQAFRIHFRRAVKVILRSKRVLSLYRPLLSGSLLEYIGVVVVLFGISAILTNGVIFHLNSELFAGGIGDATGGFLWIMFADRGWNPAWAHTQLINYPYGQNLSNPMFVTWALVLYPLWLLSRIISPFAALTIITFLGFVSCGLITYALVKRLTGMWYVAAFAAFATAFMPYHIFKSSTHLTNVFSWVFIAIIASAIAFWRKQTWRRGLLLAASIAAAVYTDGYYIFVGGVLCLALLISLVVVDVLRGARSMSLLTRLKGLGVVLAALLVLLIPVVVVQATSASQISQGLSNDRSDIKTEVAMYAAHPVDFLLPPGGNVFVSHFGVYQKLAAIQGRHSNNLENTNYIGYTVLVLDGLGVVYSVKAIRRARRNKGSISAADQVMAVCLLAAPLTLMWMLPPRLFNIEMPIGYLTDFVAYWRVPARAILALQPLLVIAAALAFAKLLSRFTVRTAILIALLATCLLAAEFNSDIYAQPFGFKYMPKAYTWIAHQKDIHAVAEVPLVDRPTEIADYYIFAQMIDNKPRVNNQLSPLVPGQYNTLGDLSNPETINFIRSRGADTVIDHTNHACQTYDWGTLVYRESPALSPPFMDGVGTTLCVYKIKSSTQAPDPYYAYAQTGFQAIDYRDPKVRYWLILDNGHPSLRVVDNQGRPITKAGMANLTAQLSFVGVPQTKMLNWTLSQKGKTIASGTGSGGDVVSATVDVTSTIDLSVTTDSFHRVPNVGEVDMRGVQITKQ